jgi:hypothetical protein
MEGAMIEGMRRGRMGGREEEGRVNWKEDEERQERG